jgi:cytochrome c oxidase cbb3-type subunit 3
MSSPCLRPSLAIGLAALLALAACDRETRDFSSGDPAQAPGVVRLSTLRPGGGPPPPPDPRLEKYGQNAYAISQGKRLFRWFNCSGCHANGGGGMGPALMDDEWRYGDRIDQIYASIDQGRPNGMPSFHGKIPPEQVWQLAAYVRSLSGAAPSSAAGSRGEEMANIPASPLQKPPSPAGEGQAAVTGAP